MTLLIFLILAAVVSEMVITSRIDYEVAKNDANMARMDMALQTVLLDALDQIRDDGSSEGSSGQTPTTTNAGSTSTTPGANAGPNDSREDAWAKKTEKTLGDVRVNYFVEDENRKFNLLSVISPDNNYAKASQDRLARIIDRLREGTDRDIGASDADRLAVAITEFLQGKARPTDIPRPALLSDIPNEEKSIPLTLDELLFVDGIEENLLYDFEEKESEYSEEKLIYPGLESVLTVWTSLRLKDTGQSTTPGTATTTNNTANATPASANQQQSGAAQGSLGVQVNLNTAPRAVMEGLFPENEVPHNVVEALIRYRNIEKEDSETSSSNSSNPLDEFTEEEDRPKQFFASVDELQQVSEFQNLSDPKAKDNFKRYGSVQSDVFSIYLTARLLETGAGAETAPEEGNTSEDEEESVGLVRRVRAVVWRKSGQNGVELVFLVPWEIRRNRKLMLRDYAPEDMPRR